MPQAVLIIEDEATLARNIASYLTLNGYQTYHASDARSGLALFEDINPDITLLDLKLPDIDGIEVLQTLRGRRSDAIVIMMTAFGEVETAVEAMKAGAHDFLRKPLALSEVKMLIDRTIEKQRTREAVIHLSAAAGTKDGIGAIVGESRPIRRLKEQVRQLCDAENNLKGDMAPAVLITGETGTGKDLVARAIHGSGPRVSGPFIDLNCAALPKELVEAELFGHEKGAFTGAGERKLGLIEAADGGTLFLDEIGEMDLSTQAKILKVIEDRTVRRVGGTRARPVNVRFIVATNRNLEAQIARGNFRSDLMFRLAVARFELPPLRERGDDVLLLARKFISTLAGRYGRPTPELPPATQQRLREHLWPGNVRELHNVLERALLFASGPVLAPDAITMTPPHIQTMPEMSSPQHAQYGVKNGMPRDADELSNLERALVIDALQQAGWNVSKAARALNLSRDQVRYRIEKFGLVAPQD